jgi:chemotaxis signal transduction protein
MLRAARQQEQIVSEKRAWNVVVFSIGGTRLAARTEDVGGVAPWIDPVPVPSRTPFVGAMLAREKDVMPVYDLGTRLRREPEGDTLLCLVARHVDGPMAICIDAVIPSLHNIEVGQIVPSKRMDLETLGSFTDEGEDIDIVALQRLGHSRPDGLRP